MAQDINAGLYTPENLLAQQESLDSGSVYLDPTTGNPSWVTNNQPIPQLNSNPAPQQAPTPPTAPTPNFPGGIAAQNSALANIDQAYNDALTAYQNQQNETTAQRDLNLQRLGTQNQQALASVGEAQKGQEQQLAASAGAVNTGATNAVNDTRRAFNELQGRNNARLSASGLSSSSVADAMQEKLSRDTFSALDQITQNRQGALQAIEQNKIKTTEFYQRQKADLATALNQAQQELQNQFQAAINRINEARNLSTSQRQQARTQVQQGVAAAYSAAQAKAAEYQYALDLHKYATDQATFSINQFTQGKYTPDQVLQNFGQINQKLRNQGYNFDANAWIAHVSNPLSTGGNFITPLQTQVVEKGKEYQAIDQWGNPVKK